MSREKRFILAAIKVSHEASPECCFSIGAVLVMGNRIVASGACTTKTHPRNPKYFSKTKRKQLCAESLTILRAMKIIDPEDLSRCTMFVARTRKNGSVSIAKPCEFCTELMRRCGIRNVYYTNRTGEIEKLKISPD